MNAKTLLIGASLLLAAPSAVLAQSNDDCSGALAISGFNTFSFDNSAATASGVNDCNGLPVRRDLWYEWTAPVSDFIRFETCGTNTAFETRIAVYTANSSCGSLTLLDCAAANCGGNGLSRLAFNAVQGQSYLMRVGSRQTGGANSGAGQFVIGPDPCNPNQDDIFEDNDDCASAVPMGNGTTTNLWCSKTDPDWYSFCVGVGATASVDVLFPTAVGDIDVFSFDGCTGLSLGVGGSASDDENLLFDNTAGLTPLNVVMRVELWISDPDFDCNGYSMVIGGTGCSGGGGGVGTTYCAANTNSTGAIANMGGAGSDVAADNNLTLNTSNLPANSFAFYLAGQVQGFVANPGGSQGNLCLSGSIGRYVGPGQIQQANAAGTISLAIDLTQVPQPTGFVSAAAGDTWNFQAWYRDAIGGSATSNFTDGLSVTFQ
ncbi:MAG: hypothetical protein P8R46_13305 [Planctomycetota bacterium]|nr:hypothetical protein [Planctomycetota bacterium]